MISPLKEHIEELLCQKPSDKQIKFFHLAVSSFYEHLREVREQYTALRLLLTDIQEEEHPLKASGQNLANLLRDYIFSALSFCTAYTEGIPHPSSEFEQSFVHSVLTEFLSAQESLTNEIKKTFSQIIQRCLTLAAKYQGVRAQS